MLLFLSIFLPMALRWNIGTDYKNYYEQILHDVQPALNKWGGFDIGWRPLLIFIKYFEIDIHFFFVVVSFFTLIFIFKLIDKKTAPIAILVYICSIWLESLSPVRQYFAVAMATYGFKLYWKEENKKGIILIILSCLFHRSCFLFLPILIFVRPIKLSPAVIICIFAFSWLFFHIVNVPNILYSRVMYAMFGNASRYFSAESEYGQATRMGTGLGVLLKEFGCLPFVLFATAKTKNISMQCVHSKQYYYSMWILYFLFVCYIWSTQITIMNRLPCLFTTYYLLAIDVLYESKNRYRKIAIYFLELIFVVIFFVNLIKNPVKTNTGMGLTPYTSIFERTY